MQSLPWLNSLLTFLTTVPTVGPFLIKVLDLLLSGSALVTPVIGVWKAVVYLVQALSGAFPGLKNVAAQLQTDDTKVEGFVNGYLLPILSDLSLISVPSASPAPAVVASKRK